MRRKFVKAREFWPFEGDIYITEQFNYQKIFIMQKTALSTPAKAKSINYFKYEMKDTNQLLKDLISCNMSDTLSRSGQNKQQNHIHDMFKQGVSLRKIENTAQLYPKKKFSHRKFIDSSQSARQMQKVPAKYSDQFQNDQNQIFRDLINDSYTNLKRKKVQNTIQDLILQKFYIDQSDNEDNQDIQKPNFQKYKNRDLEFAGNQRYDEIREMKKQKKGLANISLRVKNIVSEEKKLTYQQVSNKVLEYSKDEINQLQQSQRIKEVKNIKRRVYDALNVLVAVGILGKHQRNVCMTEWTDIPGKKLSGQWQKINSKIQHINKLKKNCADKSQALKLLMDKYNAISALRNKHVQQEQQQQVAKQNQNLEMIKLESEQVNLIDKKLMFPVIVFCPAFDEDLSDKLTVQFEEGQQNNYKEGQEEINEKVKISGKNITILGDFDCALELDLQKYRNLEQQKKLQLQIQDYAQQCVKKIFPSFKLETDDYPEENIEDYFNEQMFESK